MTLIISRALWTAHRRLPLSDEVQLFGSHMDHIVLMTKQGMTKMPKYVLYASTAFAPHLNHVEMQAKAEEFYSAYDEGFGECNRYEHAWGPELAFYATCGFESYADFAAGVNKVMKIFEGRLATASLYLNILNHRGFILNQGRIERGKAAVAAIAVTVGPTATPP